MSSYIISTNPGSRERMYERQPLLRRHQVEGPSLLMISILAGCLLFGSVIGIYLLIVEGEHWELHTIPYTFVSRAGWKAQYPKHVERLYPPIKNVYLTQTNTSECQDQYSCVSLIRQLQVEHMQNKNLSDIAYNFLVSTNGVVFEGRGWEVQNQLSGSTSTISIALIGSYVNRIPDHDQLEEVKLLISECVQWKQLAPCYQIIYDPNLNLSEEMRFWFEEDLPVFCNFQIKN